MVVLVEIAIILSESKHMREDIRKQVVNLTQIFSKVINNGVDVFGWNDNVRIMVMFFKDINIGKYLLGSFHLSYFTYSFT